MGERIRVGIGSDLTAPDGSSLMAAALEEHFAPRDGLEWEMFGEPRAELSSADIGDFDAVITLWQQFTPATFAGVERLATIARWGVGYDMVDVGACTENDVLVLITRDAVRRPVAEAILTYVLVLAKRVLDNDRLVRTARWDEKGSQLGLRPLGLARVLAVDPYVSEDAAAELGVELTDLESLLGEIPPHVVNREVLDRPAFKAKLEQLRERWKTISIT